MLNNLAIAENHRYNSSAGVLESCRSLRSLDISAHTTWSDIAYVLLNLPPSARCLRIVGHAPSPADTASLAVAAQLDAIIPKFTTFAVGDCNSSSSKLAPPGFFNGVVSKLSSVERLTIYPTAVTDLAPSLGTLPHLTTLSLQATPAQNAPGLPCAELIELIRASSSLRSISICPVVCGAWSCDEQTTLERATADNKVDLVWLPMTKYYV